VGTCTVGATLWHRLSDCATANNRVCDSRFAATSFYPIEIERTDFGMQFTAAGAPVFEPLAVFGGVLWATGNVMAVPIIQCIGMGERNRLTAPLIHNLLTVCLVVVA
jgi:hypothetical protein